MPRCRLRTCRKCDKKSLRQAHSRLVLVVAGDGLVGVDGEGLPHDDFADVGGDEEGDAAAKAVFLLKKPNKMLQRC